MIGRQAQRYRPCRLRQDLRSRSDRSLRRGPTSPDRPSGSARDGSTAFGSTRRTRATRWSISSTTSPPQSRLIALLDQSKAGPRLAFRVIRVISNTPRRWPLYLQADAERLPLRFNALAAMDAIPFFIGWKN